MRLSVTTSGLSYVQHKTISIDSTCESPAQFEIHQTDMILSGAKISNRGNSHHKSHSYSNFFIGDNIRVTIAAHSDSLLFTNIYPGIDWQIFVSGETFKHQFIVRNPDNVGLIRMNFSGASDIIVDDNGSRLNLVTPFGKITEGKLVTVSLIDHSAISSSYVLRNQSVGFSVPDQLNPFVIDPPLLWATYLGGSDLEWPFTLTTDDTSNLFVSGLTWSFDFPTLDPGTGGIYSDTIVGWNDVFLCKYDSARHLLWSTYFGSTGNEDCRGGLCVDNNGHIYLIGTATTTDLPLINTGNGMYFQPSMNGFWDLFISTFNSNGILFRSTYYGGLNNDQAYISALDGQGHLCIAGRTESTNFPIFNPGNSAYYQPNNVGNNYDDFIIELDTSGVRRWATYLGGTSNDVLYDVCFNRKGELFASCMTSSPVVSFPTFDPGSPAYFYSGSAPSGMILVKFGLNREMLWCTPVGPVDSYVTGFNIETDELGNLVVVGSTGATNFPIVDLGNGAWVQQLPSTIVGGMPFIMQFDTSLILTWSTLFYGPNSGATFYSLSIDSSGYIYPCGTFRGSACNPYTTSPNSYYQSVNAGGYDFLITRFSPTRALTWSTLYGGASDEELPVNTDFTFNTVIDGRQHLLVQGATNSTAIPLRNRGNNAYMDSTFSGNFDAVILEFGTTCYVPEQINQITVSDSSLCTGDTVNIMINVSVGAQGYNWTTAGGLVLLDSTNGLMYTILASDTGTVCVNAFNACGTSINQCVPVNPMAPGGAVIFSDSIVCAGDTISFLLNGANTVYWSPGIGLSDSLSTSPVTVVVSGITYLVYMVDSNGCSSTDSIQLTINPDCIQPVADCFLTVSPNPSSGSVGLFTTCPSDSLAGYRLRLYNVLGQIVYENTDLGQGWNNLDDFELADAMYLYVIEDDQQILSAGKILNIRLR